MSAQAGTLNAGPNAYASLMRRNESEFEEAVSKAKLQSSSTLGVTATLQLMNAAQTTWTGLRKIRTLLKTQGIYMRVASEAEIKKFLARFDVHTSYYTMPLHTGSKHGDDTVMSLIMTASVHDSLARDLDYIWDPNTTVQFDSLDWFTPHGPPSPRSTIHSVSTQDKGGSSAKWAVSHKI